MPEPTPAEVVPDAEAGSDDPIEPVQDATVATDDPTVTPEEPFVAPETPTDVPVPVIEDVATFTPTVASDSIAPDVEATRAADTALAAIVTETANPVAAESPTPTTEPLAATGDVADAEALVDLPFAVSGPARYSDATNAVAFPTAGGFGIVDLDTGQTLAISGIGGQPLWSPSGQYLLGSGSGGAIALADVTTGLIAFPLADPEDGAPRVDVPAGWIDGAFYFQRTFPGSPGRIELRIGNVDGSLDRVIWSADGVTPVSSQPIKVGNAFLIATTDEWFAIAADGTETTLGTNPYPAVGGGFSGDANLAYDIGGAVVVAAAAAPGSAFAEIPTSSGAFDWAPTLDRLVTSDGLNLTISGLDGSVLGTAANANGLSLGPPLWLGDDLWFVRGTQFVRMSVTDLTAA